MTETQTEQQTAELKADNYELSSGKPKNSIPAPDLPYQPRDPEAYKPNIGLIACGGITEAHLKAYQKAGYNVVALCDLIEERARKRQAQFFPDAVVTTDYREILKRDDIAVVDIATHPQRAVPHHRSRATCGQTRFEPEAVRAGFGQGTGTR